jgi:putative molybdopterin biosynthesis protein
MTPTGSLPERLLTVKDVQLFLGVSEDFIYDEVARGSLRAVRIGRQLRFRQSDVDDYVEARLIDVR